ncbi:hypothetical protein Vadar_032894 [Vaccinium darrowii]|uniref:Uncharacterized protein n=1 Tax=Vaccinium darrowii TaxID=229202 RepID=A0ACB7Y390_9ERIC|nr:hypothetical protein Vadar_032894 [Vaccinium darrowii]
MKKKKGHLRRCTARAPTAVEQSTVEDGVTMASSAIAIAENDDILAEILVRTPFKSQVRFKSVSKSWLSLISSSRFSLLRNSYSRLSGLLLRKKWPYLVHPAPAGGPYFEFVSPKSSFSRDPPVKSLSFIPSNENFSGVDILQSCNGLLLCTSRLLKCGTDPSYFVVNPTTKQYIQFYPPGDVSGLDIAFDPLRSHHYKLVCVRRSITPSFGHYHIEIYSSENRCWRVSGKSFTGRECNTFTNGVFWNGSIHWIGAWSRFNIDLECIEEMPAFPRIQRNFRIGKPMLLRESNGHLHLIEELSTTKFQVFEMESDYSGWFVKYHVDLDCVVAAFPAIVHSYPEPFTTYFREYYAFSILSIIREEKEDESVLLLNVSDKVVSYSFKGGTLTDLLDVVPEKIDERYMLRLPGRSNVCRPQFTKDDAFHYIESLALV